MKSSRLVGGFEWLPKKYRTRAIDRGAIRDRAEAARKLGLTRARVTQLLDMTLLAPGIQGQVLLLESVDGIEPMNEHYLRRVLGSTIWAEQRKVWRQVRSTAEATATS